MPGYLRSVPPGQQPLRAAAESKNLGFNLVCALRLRLETIRDKFFVG
jgi:hypothetical protein